MPDDEEDEDDEDDVEMELVAGSGAPVGTASTAAGAEGLGGGFLSEPADAGPGGGGFIVEDDGPPAGGFLPEPVGGGGGFLTEADQGATMSGGFLPEPAASDVGGGGGFFLPDPSSLDTPMRPAESDFGGGGGFLPPPDNFSHDPDSFAGAGGFLLDDGDDGPSTSLSSLLPTPAPLTNRLPTPPPPPSRIPLARIPAALRDLGLHRVGLAGAELIALFDDVASEDEDDPMRGRSVRRERFVEACEVLLGDEEPPSAEEDKEDEGEGAGEQDDLGLGEGRRRRRQPTRQQPSRRSTRGRRAAAQGDDEGDDDEAQDDVVEKDFGGEVGVDESSSSFESESDVDIDDEDEDEDDLPAKGKKAAAKKGAKGRRAAKGDPSRPLSKQDLADAADSFNLFFDESPQLAFGQQERVLTLMELQRACRVLKEKMSDGDVRPALSLSLSSCASSSSTAARLTLLSQQLNEMLEYAAKSKGVVDLEAFARILVETGL